jgi:dTMP kinase
MAIEAGGLTGQTSVFITLEGIDRSGKTTQARLLADAIGAVLLREPGGTDAGERIRELLADPLVELDPVSELLLFGAARAELVRREIRPALEAGRDVVCDRFTDSTLAYQGAGRGLGTDTVQKLNAVATGGLAPDLTVLLRLDAEPAAEREGGGEDRFEREGLELQRAVAAAYDEIARREPERVAVVDAARDVDAVHADVLAAVERARPMTGLPEPRR